MRTPDEVKEILKIRGLSIAEWARDNGFAPKQVYQVLNAKHRPMRGKSHAIAVKLGLKDGIIEPDFNFEKMEESK
ncbi:MAG: DNA-binding protein [Acinetobacter populi]|jgi:gp16 family phage-associated protein|uniref:DNA-binding protein n=1 Tax=Acinetobacter populi TaxID=1582270 RepID=UPI0023572A5A|nr:DNA-binding protein [Acinetobacter populi]MCH4248517.1 DNA-binding protein [Acinetobacter populi]